MALKSLRDLLYPGNQTEFPLSSSLATLVLFSCAHVRPFIHHGQPPHHQARRMMQVAAQYAIYPGD